MNNNGNHQGSKSSADGGAWIVRYLIPQLNGRFPNLKNLDCLQIWPDDTKEAEKLNALGHRCTMIAPEADKRLPFPDATFDFAFTGRLLRHAQNHAARAKFALEVSRILRPGGALLLAVGNRLCPIDLTKNGSTFHFFQSSIAALSRDDAKRAFIQENGFQSLYPLPINGHFSWNRLPRLIRPTATFMDAYWKYLARPSYSWLYFSPFNPILILWLQKN